MAKYRPVKIATSGLLGGVDIAAEEGVAFHVADSEKAGKKPNVVLSNLQHIFRAVSLPAAAITTYMAPEGSTMAEVGEAGLDAVIPLGEKTVRDLIKNALKASAQAQESPRMRLAQQQNQRAPPSPNITIHTL